MTQNQLQYWRNQETERANRASEANDYIKALASRLQANVAERNLENQYLQAMASQKQADAATKQANVSERNLANLAKQAAASEKQASVAERNLANLSQQASASYTQAQASMRNAQTNEKHYYLDQMLKQYQSRELEARAAEELASATKTQIETGSGWASALGNILKAVSAFF